MNINIRKPLYCIDKTTKEKYLISSINFPLGGLSGKDITVEVEDDLLEWRSIEDVEIISNVGD